MVDTYFSVGFRFIDMKIRDASGLGEHGYLGGSSEFTPIVLLDSGHNFENLHRWLGYDGRCIPAAYIHGIYDPGSYMPYIYVATA
jgi:hypothetical protein